MKYNVVFLVQFLESHPTPLEHQDLIKQILAFYGLQLS